MAASSSIEVPVSLVVPCYERVDQTRTLLRSLEAATSSCEIVLVDDASPHSLEPVVREFPDLNIKYFRNATNRGPSYSRNLGISLSRHGLVAFTDNDCVAEATWLVRLHESIVDSPSKIAGVGGRVAAAQSDLISQYFDYHKILDPWYYRGRYHYLTTANAIFKRHAVELVGGFDEALLVAGGEDPGLCFKLQNAGYSLGYNPEALIWHQYAPSLRAFMRTFYRYGYGCAVQSSKHFRPQGFVQNGSFGALDGSGD